MSRRKRARRATSVGVLLALLVAAGAVALLRGGEPASTAAPQGELGEMAPALAGKLARIIETAPPGGMSGWQEGDRGGEAADEWLQRALPGTDIPSAAIAAARSDWKRVQGRGAAGEGGWVPLGPTWAKGLPNPYRDRSVYNAGTPDFTGRIAHVAIDPNCGAGGPRAGCRLWIANANGGVWRTDDALADEPDWRFLSDVFEHNSIGALELDPNDASASTLWAGTGEPNSCGSGCEAGVGLYRSTNGGDSWTGPLGRAAFYNRAVGSIEVKPGSPSTIFAASGRGIRGVSSACCGGVDALIPGAPHFGLYRSLDGGASWQLVHQGATVLCTAVDPDVVSLNGTPCSPRGARRVKIDPVDPNTVYASYYARGIWRSRQNGDPGTWEQIMAPVGPIGPNERAEFDVVALPGGETRMYVGVGGGVMPNATPPPATIAAYARFRRNDAVRNAPAATVAGSWIDLTNPTPDTPGYSSRGYCDPQCIYDNYVFAPAAHFPQSGADPDTVYLSGDNEYGENNWVTGRSNGRGVLLSTNAGVHFTDMTDDDSDDVYPVELHPDHHALTVNPRNWRQFFDVGDGGIVRSNGVFVDDSGDCVDPKRYTGSRLAFCQLVLSRVPQRIDTLNKGLRTLHFYQLNSSPHDPRVLIGGTQDNGSWEIGDTEGSGTNGPGFPRRPGLVESQCRAGSGAGGIGSGGGGGEQVWVNTNIADGGHNNFDIGDPCFRQTSFQVGQMMVAYEPKNQLDQNWIADTQFVFYGNEANAFVGVANDDRVHPHWLWSAREHVFRSTNQGRNPVMTKEEHREHCNIWYGDADVDENGVYEPAKDICDDWKPLGDPGPNGRLTSPVYGDRPGGYTAVVERARDSGTLWAATQTGRVFVSKNADHPNPAAVVFDRIDDEAANDPPRYPSAIHVDPNDPNHAWITYSGFNAKTPGTPGHVFEVRYVPGASTFRMLDGTGSGSFGDIPATAIAVSDRGTLFVGTDFGVVTSSGDGVWREAGVGLPNTVAADLVYVHDPARGAKTLYVGTHGQGAWSLNVNQVERGR